MALAQRIAEVFRRSQDCTHPDDYTGEVCALCILDAVRAETDNALAKERVKLRGKIQEALDALGRPPAYPAPVGEAVRILDAFKRRL